MTLFDSWGMETPVTVLQLDQVTVVAHKTDEKEGYAALQVGAGPRKEKHTSKPLAGHFAACGVSPRHVLREFRVTPDALIPVGTEINAAHFVPGQYVDVAGITCASFEHFAESAASNALGAGSARASRAP